MKNKYELFKQIIIECNYDNTYKMAWGKSIVELLKDNVPAIVLKLQGSHFMRWDNFDEKFQRPIRWIVSIMDNKEVPLEIINVKSGKVSRGHRFSKNQTVEINHPDEYVEKLRSANVIVDQAERKGLPHYKTASSAD